MLRDDGRPCASCSWARSRSSTTPGCALGYVTSAGYGATVGESIAYGYLPVSHAEPGTRVGVWCDGAVNEAAVVAEPLYDPAMDRLRDVAPATPA